MDCVVPAGVVYEGQLVTKHDGRNDDAWEWLSYPKIKRYTNAFIVQDDKVSLISALCRAIDADNT